MTKTFVVQRDDRQTMSE